MTLAAANTGPSNIGVPSGPSAVSTTRDGCAMRVRSPGTRGAGSHTNVTRVFPSADRATPNHGRISGLVRHGSAKPGGSGAASGAPPFASRSTASPSSGHSAQYPLRARTRTPGRFTFT